MMPMDRQLPNGRRASAGARDLADSKRDCVDAQGFDLRFERLARNAELRRGARGPGDPSPDAESAASISSFSPSASVVTWRATRLDGKCGFPLSHDSSIA